MLPGGKLKRGVIRQFVDPDDMGILPVPVFLSIGNETYRQERQYKNVLCKIMIDLAYFLVIAIS